MIVNRKLMENDIEGQDKLIEYDKLAVYETEYQPISESDLNRDIDEEEFDNEDNAEPRRKRPATLSQNNSEHQDDKSSKSKAADSNNILKKIIEEKDEEVMNGAKDLEENKKELDESIDILVKKADSQGQTPQNKDLFKSNYKFLKPSLLKRRNENSFEKPNLGNDKERKNSLQFETGSKMFVTLKTPRDKVDDLENADEDTLRQMNPLKKKPTKSVTFDFRQIDDEEDLKEEKEYSSESNESEEAEEVKKEKEKYFGNDDQDSSNLVETKDSKWYWKVFNHMRYSSLLIFHKDSKFRKILISLVVNKELDGEISGNNIDEIPGDSAPNHTRFRDGDEIPSKSMPLRGQRSFEESKLEMSGKKAKSFFPQHTNKSEERPDRSINGGVEIKMVEKSK